MNSRLKRIMTEYPRPNTGKTTLALHAIAELQKTGGSLEGWVVAFVASYCFSTDVSLSYVQLTITIARC